MKPPPQKKQQTCESFCSRWKMLGHAEQVEPRDRTQQQQTRSLKKTWKLRFSPRPQWLERESQTFSRYREGELRLKGLWPASGEGQQGFTACLRGEGQRFFPDFMTCFRREGWREGENDLSVFAVFPKVRGPYWRENALIPFKCKTLRMLGERQCPLRFS